MKCETGCMSYTGGEIRHHEDCVFYPESRTKMFEDMEKAIEFALNKIYILEHTPKGVRSDLKIDLLKMKRAFLNLPNISHKP